MSCITVTTQADLDTALADKAECIHIESEAGVWLTVRDSGSSRVVAWGSSSVEAWDSSRVEAWDSSRVVAWGSSSVVARGSSRVEAWDSSRVVAWDSSSVVAWDSSSVVAWDSSSVVAWGSSRVVARGSSRVEAWDSSRVEAWDSSRVVARGSSSVVARGSSSVEAWDSSRVEARGAAGVHAHQRATVTAGPHVAVHLHSGQATVAGGVVIDLTQLDLTDPATWCDHHGVPVQGGHAVLYKAVDETLAAGHDYTRTVYPVGAEVTVADWRDDHECGGGLHVSPRPAQAGAYCNAATKRYLRVVVPVESLRPIGADKCKVPALQVVCEVDVHGRELAMADVELAVAAPGSNLDGAR